MIKRCAIKDQDVVISYIGNNYPRCLYLYLDLRKYGIGSETVDVYIQMEQDRISAVLLKYYSCLHVYSQDDTFDEAELSEFIQQKQFSMVYCMASTAKKIYSCFPKSLRNKVSVSTGWVAQIILVDQAPQGLAVPAKREDFDQIVRLIYDDEDIGRSYQYDELAKQLEERNLQGYARNIVIKQNDLVIAHACTNAELDHIAVVAELLVRKEYRRQGYASEIWRDICKTLLSEGKEVYSFYYSEESRRLHHKIGFHEVCEWSKIVIKNEN